MKQTVRRTARSLYRQVRITCTQESGGRVSYSIYAKGLNQAWSEHQCLVRDQITLDERLETTEDVVRMLLIVLSEQLLPESHTD